jgi:mono/diheme cytochrome c family protein
MKYPPPGRGLFVVGVLIAGAAFAQDQPLPVLFGRATYRSHCATCHGTDARGEGPMADRLRVRPPDLTLLARRNGGPYPADKVHRIIDGRDPVKGHGGPDMPIWGDAFKNTSEGYSEDKVKERIDGLVEYLRSLQAPPLQK